jgi:1-acyl-sn-glycerol-3-phosphate acyltransferase
MVIAKELEMSKKSILSKRILLASLIALLGISGSIIFHTQIMSLLAFLQNQHAISTWFQSIGPIGPIALFILMIFQVFIAVLPGQPLMLAGGYIFDKELAVFITATGSILGSQLAFWLARRYGHNLVKHLVGQAELERWNRISEHQGTLFFFTTIVVPCLPSDLMCYVAGLGSISTRKFLAANICGRTISALMITLMGAYGFNPPWQYWVLIPGSTVVFVIAWWVFQKEKSLSEWRSRFAIEFSLWLLNTYRRLFSIRMQVSGLENMPTGPKIIAANHPNCSDTFILYTLFQGNLRILAQASQFHQPFFGWLFTHTGQIPVYKENRQEAYLKAQQALSRGDSLLVFPEGRLNPDHQKIKIFTGAVRLSLECNVPIIPVGIHVRRVDTVDLNRFASKDRSQKLWQTGGKFFAHFGAPWSPFSKERQGISQDEIHDMTGFLMEKIYYLEDQAQKECEYENSHCRSGLPTHDKWSRPFLLPSGRIPR